MKKLYSFLLAISLLIPVTTVGMPTSKPHKSTTQRWWDVRSWNKKKVAGYSAATFIAIALAIFGSYWRVIAYTKAQLARQLEQGTLPASQPQNKALITAYHDASVDGKKGIIDNIVANMTWEDIAAKAVGYVTGNPNYPF